MQRKVREAKVSTGVERLDGTPNRLGRWGGWGVGGGENK